MKSVKRSAAHTVDIIGFGDIGRAFANRIRGFGPAKSVAHDPYVHQNTPHLAGFSPLFLEECPIRQAENIMRVLSGRAPHGLANPEVIKTIAVMRSVNPDRWVDIPDFSTALAA